MRNSLKILLLAVLLMPAALNLFSQDQCAPVGWATQNGGTTGGGSATPITVTTLSALQSNASSSGAKVIYVSGTMGAGVGTRVNVAADKTIIGLPGAKLIGGFDVKAKNVIIRNMIIQGPGAVDVNGVDCITIDGSSTTNVWIDHCDIYDGQDGNLDITNGANYIAITWCRFRYTSASSNHQFCNLIGNSDTKTSDRGKLKVTMMYNWWGAGCKERMPRLRFGQVHVVNNYFNCTGNSYCVRAGTEANLLVESNYFDGVSMPIDLYQNNFTAVTSRNNTFVSTSGNTAGSGTAFTPPYSLSITPSANIKSAVMAAAGPTMPSPTTCSGTVATYTLSTTASPAAGGTVTGAGTYNSGTVVTVTATPAAGYTFTGWSGDATGTNTSTTVTMSSNKSVTANFAPVVINYTLATTASPAAGGTVSGAGSYASGTVVTVTATPAAGYTFTGWSGDATGTNASTTVTMTANKSVTANFAPVVTNYTLATTASPAAGGTISGAGSYASGTVVTVTATPAAGYTFTGWSGDATGTNTSTTVTMNSNKSVTANFTVIPPTTFTLTTSSSPAAGGTVSGAGTYNSGTVATVTATPAAGYTFVNWSGDATGTNASTTVTMSSNKSVTANFQLSGGGGNTTIRIEDDATTATGLCLYEGSISSNSGANNGKVINLTNSTAKGVNWRVNVPSAGSYTLNWRYVNSSTSNTYSMKFILNGVTVNAALPFPKTSSSTVFANTTTTVTLNAGNNDIRLESIASNATADIDWIEITGNSPVAGNCAAARPFIRNTATEIITKQITGVFPNPATGKVNIGINLAASGIINIRILNANGSLIANLGNRLCSKGYQKITHSLAGMRPGIYHVVITGSRRESKQVMKLIVQ